MAFKASGRDLWVGSGEQYTKLKDAIAASRDGDTIHLKAGTYVNDFSTITNSVRIVGEGSGAHLKSTVSNISNGKAILIVRADVEIENIEFSGAKVSAGNGAGIRFETGSLSIKDSHFHHNQNGILTAHPSDGRVTIDNSEFGYNGSGSGQTHGIYIGRIASLKVTDSYFHDTKAGHHIKSRADETTILNSRLLDAGGNADYNIDLPNGNHAVIRGNVLEQSAASANRTIVHYGGEASSYTGSLLVEGNEFISHGGNGTGVRNQTPITVRIEDNVFHNVDTIARGPNSQGKNTVYDDLSQVGKPAPAPAPSPEPEPAPEPSPSPDPDSSSSTIDLRVRVSGDDYNGDPKFNLYLDGKKLGSTKTVTADHDQGEWQTFTFSGTVGADGPGEVAVRFINDAWGGSDAKDRNLYVDWIEVEGTRIQAEAATFERSNGATLPGREKMAWNGSLVFDTENVELLGIASSPADDGMIG